jgi:hypothetical protein
MTRSMVAVPVLDIVNDFVAKVNHYGFLVIVSY